MWFSYLPSLSNTKNLAFDFSKVIPPSSQMITTHIY